MNGFGIWHSCTYLAALLTIETKANKRTGKSINKSYQ